MEWLAPSLYQAVVLPDQMDRKLTARELVADKDRTLVGDERQRPIGQDGVPLVLQFLFDDLARVSEVRLSSQPDRQSSTGGDDPATLHDRKAPGERPRSCARSSTLSQ